MMDLKCPHCGSENTTRVPIEIIDSSIKSTWWMIVIFGILGVSLNPLILILAFAVMLLNLIVNIANKHKYRNVWIMQCQRCKKEFTVSDPDKMKKRDKKSLERQTKQAERELSKKEKEEHRRAVQLEKSQKEADLLKKNSMLYEDETLISEVDYFATHRNAWSTAGGSLRITDKCLLIYNRKGAFRIYKNQIMSIRKKNYFLIIPTGIQIKANSDKKKRKYNFVVMYDQRKQIIGELEKFMG